MDPAMLVFGVIVFALGFATGWAAKAKRLHVVLAALTGAGPALGGPGAAVVTAAADLAKLPEEDRGHYRYLWHPQPVLPPRPAVGVVAGLASEFHDFDLVLRYHVNQLSRAGFPVPPARIAFDLWRVDLRDYQWDAATWEKMATRNLYFNRTFSKVVTARVRGRLTEKRVRRAGPAEWLPTDEAAYLIAETGSKTPVVSAPWFLANTCRQLTLTNEQLGFGYYDWLKVASRADFFDLADVRLEETRKRGRDALEAVDVSGVSRQNRQVDSEPTINGWLFFTLDTDNESGAGNAVENLKRGDFVHKAEEHYLPLPNGLPAYLLCDEKGALQPSAPDFIGADRSPLNASTDPRIHVGIACLRCHGGQVLQPIKGWARSQFTVDRLALNVLNQFRHESPDERKRLADELTRQYLRINFTNRLNQQREAYRQAIHEACGLPPAELARRFARAYHAYADDPVTLEQAARELGHAPERVRAALLWYGSPKGRGGIKAQLGALALDPSRPLPRLHWEGLYDDAQEILTAYETEAPAP